jgi:hypothetical protein
MAAAKGCALVKNEVRPLNAVVAVRVDFCDASAVSAHPLRDFLLSCRTFVL